jgi:hypothetical protein
VALPGQKAKAYHSFEAAPYVIPVGSESPVAMISLSPEGLTLTILPVHGLFYDYLYEESLYIYLIPFIKKAVRKKLELI